MDTVQTAVGKEDALKKAMDENNAIGDGVAAAKTTTACAGDDGADSVPASDKAIVGSAKVAGLHIAAPPDTDASDDLLDKIEEVVKDEGSNGRIAVDKAIAESSEQDFLKQLEEAEGDTKSLKGDDNESPAAGDKDAIDLTEENVSSSDEKEKAGNAASEEIAEDEADRAHAVDDNVADSTNHELNDNADKRIIRIDSIEDSDVEIVSSETNEKAVHRKASSEVDSDQSEVGKNATEANPSGGEKKSLENGEIDLTAGDDSDNASDKDDVEIVCNKADDAIIVSSSGVNEAEGKIVSPTEQSVPLESIEEAEAKSEASSTQIPNKEVEETVSVSSSEGEQAEVEASTEAIKQISDEKVELGKKVSQDQPMSVDQSPDAAMDTMEVDEEEKMDVDMIETISDEEMPVVAEEKPTEASEDVGAVSTSQPQMVHMSTTAIEEPASENKAPTTENEASTTIPVEEEPPEEDKEAESAPEALHAASIPNPSPTEKSNKEPNEAEEPTATEEDAVQQEDIEFLESETKTQPEAIEATEKQISPAAEPSISTSEENPESKTIKNNTSDLSKQDSPTKSTLPNCIAAKDDKQPKIVEPKDTPDTVAKTSESASLNATEETLGKLSKVNDSEHDPTIDKLGGVKPENKLLTNAMKHGGSVASLDGSPMAAPTSTVFNSTPIQKQFDISSENVSKISDVHEEVNRTSEENHTTEEVTSSSSKTEEETCETGTTSNSEAHQTTDSATKFLNVIKQQYNGATSEDSDIPRKVSKAPQEKSFEIMPVEMLSKSADSSLTGSSYGISVWYDDHDIRFLSVEKLEKKAMNAVLESTGGGESSEKMSSNGSVSSLPQFALTNRTLDTLSGSSTSSKTPDTKPNLSQENRTTHTVTGIVDLCKFMIDQFTKIKNKHDPPTTPTSSKTLPATEGEDPSTPKLKGPASSKKSLSKTKTDSSHDDEPDTPSKRAEKRTLKRALTKSQSDDEEEYKPKQAKQAKSTSKSQESATKNTADSLYCCLAKWVDKKYYAGHVTEEKAGNKFVVLFEDGASKVLPRESIVFGEDDILPLVDQSVYALLDDDYELGMVKSVEKTDDKVLYTVDINGKDIKVSGSDIYLTDQQAKTIQSLRDVQSTPSSMAKHAADSPTEKSSPGGASSRSTRKRPATSPITPEAGFSGGVTKRGGRKPKRVRAETRLSESTDVSDSPEAVEPPSPESALEAIEGVQPELQKTPKESEISRMIIMSDYMKSDPARDIGELIGCLPKIKTLFKNKCFLLTCTVAQKLPPYGAADRGPVRSKNIPQCSEQFTTIPFIKDNLRKQIEQGGGKVYDHFEDVPKSKYRQCKLIASRPCTTAKYVQCLAADIPALSHEWIIDSCKRNSLIDYKKYHLPSGWSIIHNKYLQWTVGRSVDHRQSNKPFQKENILIASGHQDFVTFWSRVCKLAGGTLRYIKSLSDVTPTTTGYMVTELDFPQIIKSKAEHYGIPIVSTAWIVQSLILGKVCDPNSHAKLREFYNDDDL